VAWLACGAALALQALPVRAENGVRLVYAYEISETPTQEETPAPGSPKRGSLVARLGPTILAVRDGDTEDVYDFAGRRHVMLDHAKRERRDVSLYWRPDFATVEIHNRRFVGEMLGMLGQKRDIAEDEIDLGVAATAPSKAKLKEKRRGDERVFLVNGRERTSFTASDTALPPELVPALRRLLVYQARLHPLVTAALLKEPRLPKRLAFQWEPLGSRKSVTWELQEVAEDDLDPAALTGGYPLLPFEREGVAETAFRVRTGQAGAPPPAASYQERVERLLADQRGFEALLVALEQQFATGDAPTDLMRRVSQASASDPRAQEVLRVIDLGQRDPKGALERIASVKAEGLEGGHVVAILRANQRLTLGQLDAALEDFALALAVNPFMIGPLMDAGKIYRHGYHTIAARECWDAVRAVAPDHPVLRDIDAADAATRKDHPEFF
jgi:hypothetical protein